MSFIKRAWISIIRRPSKSIILLLIIFILGNIIAGAISIRQGALSTQIALQKKMFPAVVLEEDTVSVIEDYGNKYYENEDYLNNIQLGYDEITELVKKLGSLPQVEYYNYSSSAIATTKSFKPYNNGNLYSTYFDLAGTCNPEHIDFPTNSSKLIEGRHFTQDEIDNLSYVAIISKKLADTNNLTCNSTMTMDIQTVEDGNPIFVDLKVVGIFEPQGEVMEGLEDNRDNQIYMPNILIDKITKDLDSVADFSSTGLTSPNLYDIVFLLKDSSQIDAFEQSGQQYLPKYYTWADNKVSYEFFATPMESMKWIASVVLLAIIGAAIIILSLLITLFLRDRRHEIGILLAIGERKIKIVGQIVLEIALISIIAISLSLFSGNILSSAVSDKMLNDQITAQEEQLEQIGYMSISSLLDFMGYSNDISSEDLREIYKVPLDVNVICLYYIIGILTVIISTIIPLIYVTRLKPKKILM